MRHSEWVLKIEGVDGLLIQSEQAWVAIGKDEISEILATGPN